MESELFGHERGRFHRRRCADCRPPGKPPTVEPLFLGRDRATWPLELQPKLTSRSSGEAGLSDLAGAALFRCRRADCRGRSTRDPVGDGAVSTQISRRPLTIGSRCFPHFPTAVAEAEEIDIPLLIEHFVQKFARRQGKLIQRVPDKALDKMTRHSLAREYIAG